MAEIPSVSFPVCRKEYKLKRERKTRNFMWLQFSLFFHLLKPGSLFFVRILHYTNDRSFSTTLSLSLLLPLQLAWTAKNKLFLFVSSRQTFMPFKRSGLWRSHFPIELLFLVIFSNCSWEWVHCWSAYIFLSSIGNGIVLIRKVWIWKLNCIMTDKRWKWMQRFPTVPNETLLCVHIT